MNQLRVGIVGCGEVTQVMHLPSLAFLHEQFSVTALCDLSDQVLQGVGDQWQVANRFKDYQDLLAQPDVDVVLVANPDAFHRNVVLAAIAAGKHVMIEKPMCISLREADEICQAVENGNVIVQVAYMRRYAPAFVQACRMIPEMGDIRLARVHDVLGRNALFTKETSRAIRGSDVPQEIISTGQRLREERITEAIGNVEPELRQAYDTMIGLSSHDISAMRELLGMPKRVLCATQRRGGLYLTATFDYGSFVCQFETGPDSIPRFDAHLEVYGNERVLRIQYDTPYVRNLPIRLHITETNGQGNATERMELPGWGDAFVAEWREFYNYVVESREPKTSPADFRKDLEIFQEMITRMRD